MFLKVLIGLIPLMFLTTLLGAYACAWGFDSKYSFMPTIIVTAAAVLMAIYAVIKEL